MQRRTFLQSMAAWSALPTPVWSKEGQTKQAPSGEEISDFCKRLRPLGRILELEGYYVWCNSPIVDDDAKTHVFYSRWPKEKGMGGWISCCEIAHAVADSPTGPYTTLDVVLAPRGPGHWDATTCHNPHIQKVGNQYCLFFMGNSNSKTNTKRIGLATSDSLNGPWTRFDHPLLEPGPEGAWDDHCTTNPSYIKHPNGESWLYYKSWNSADYLNDKPPIRGNRKYGLAIADKLTGPYEKHPYNPLIDFSGLGENRQCEDAFVWLEDGVFKMIARDMGVFNHEVGLYMESKDGVHWSEPTIAFYDLAHYVNQPPAPRHLKRYGRLERPQLLIQDGRPSHLFGASQGGRFETASGFVFELIS
ncbi:glycoside hydrolase family protein [Bythopirellula goksoeyrii]|uniref:Glycosyl hydrolases family 43 n=1 Tax=Bythopirellula goksoeyrii TaxID=1400387 RepID=A0A5B9Q8L1_9BACT|nr:glycoside hydrolase family protein [Bythopirellula goksoeyrii]QEG35414.1 Glycosyl hydrolases family 43 [Bythopirellula goksoeyrii]